jgi:membrane protease YdiL (CAAX protease family)
LLRRLGIFGCQQAVIFAISAALIAGMRSLTGTDVRAGRSPIGLVSFLIIAGMFTAIILCTRWFYRFTVDRASRDTVLAPSGVNAMAFLIGTTIAFLLSGAPTLVALATGQMRIVKTIAGEFPPAMLLYVVPVGMVLLIYNSVMEEYASRAFPLALFQASSLVVRIALPALLFAAAHLAVEPFRLPAFYTRFVSGAVLGVAFLLTRNVWLASGVHTGMNLAVLAGSGRWYFGGLALVEGTTPGPEWITTALWTVVLGLGLVWLHAHDPNDVGRTAVAKRPRPEAAWRDGSC